jgi:hypothetical protein
MTDSCYFCGSDVAPADQLRYDLALEAWHESADAQAITGDAAFAEEPQLTCKSCRHGIEQNKAELTADTAVYQQNLRFWLVLALAIAGVIAGIVTGQCIKRSASLSEDRLELTCTC